MKQRKLTIRFYDVEHGSCTHIITPNGKHILVDVGSKPNKSIIHHIRRKYGIRNIDELIITHPHEDHICDLPNLMNYLKPLILFRPKDAFNIHPKRSTEYSLNIAQVANEMHQEYDASVAGANNVNLPDNNGGVDIEIIPSVWALRDKDDYNTFSCVVIVNYGNYRFVIMGDNPKSQLQYMIDHDYCGIKSKISYATAFLAPHHGRVGELCEDFFKYVNPRLSVISDKEIVHETQTDSSHKYKGRGVNLDGQMRYVLSTRHDGTITFECTPTECTVDWNRDEY